MKIRRRKILELNTRDFVDQIREHVLINGEFV